MTDHLEPRPGKKPSIIADLTAESDQDRREQEVISGLMRELCKAHAALAIEQQAADALRVEYGDMPLGPVREYSGPLLKQHETRIVVHPSSGGGLTTRRES